MREFKPNLAGLISHNSSAATNVRPTHGRPKLLSDQKELREASPRSSPARNASFLAATLGILWLLVLLWPGRWHYSDVADFYAFDVGLYGVNGKTQIRAGMKVMNLRCTLQRRDDPACQERYEKLGEALGSKVNGRKSLSFVTRQFCELPEMPGSFQDDLCEMWTHVQYSGLMMLGCGIISVTFLGAGAFYSGGKLATDVSQDRVRGIYFVAPVSASLGLAQYFYFTQDFDVSDRKDRSFSMAFYVALGLCFVSLSPGFMTRKQILEEASPLPSRREPKGESQQTNSTSMSTSSSPRGQSWWGLVGSDSCSVLLGNSPQLTYGTAPSSPRSMERQRTPGSPEEIDRKSKRQHAWSELPGREGNTFKGFGSITRSDRSPSDIDNGQLLRQDGFVPV